MLQYDWQPNGRMLLCNRPWTFVNSDKEVMFLPVCVCLLVCLLTGLLKNYWTNLYKKNLKNGWTYSCYQLISFWVILTQGN